MSKKAKKMKNKSTLILFIVFIILLVIYFIIPKERTVTKILSADEYKKQIYDEVYKELNPQESFEKQEENDIEQEENLDKEQQNEDELYKLQT